MLLGILGATLFGSLLTGKVPITSWRQGTIRSNEGTVRAGQDFLCGLII